MGYSTGRKPWRSEPFRDVPDDSLAARNKLFYFGVVIFVVFGVLTLQLIRMQLVQGASYRQRAEHNRLREVPTLPTRGLVYDRNGLPLVENRASFAAAVVPADVPRDQETAITIGLQELTGVPAGDIAQKIDVRRRSNDPFTPLVIKDDISQETAFALRERLPGLPGVRVLVQPKRDYPEGPLVAHILGFVGPINEDEYANLSGSGYQLNDRIGKAGVEDTYESVLRGVPGVRDVETDASGRELRVIDDQPARPGNNVVLSIDVNLQRQVENIIRGAMGKSRYAAAVVTDVRTGELLALVSLPGYDDNIFTGNVDQGVLDKMNNDPSKPMLDHAIAEMYPPGSTFKQITGLAALQEGIANASTQITSRGSIQVKNQYNPSIVYTFRDWAALGPLNFYRGVAMSSDVYFYYLAGGYSENGVDLFQGLGAARLADWTRRFGLGAKTGIDLPGESAGLVPDPDWKQRTLGEPWTIGDTYNFGIGQGYVTATPLQMALVTTAVANGGDLMQPHVVHQIRDADGRDITPARSFVRRNLGIDPRNLAIFRQGMRQAVGDPDGTAKGAASRYAAVAGKTGTAEFGAQRPDGSYTEHAWFTGFAPFNDPQIAVAVFLDDGNGAINAAPAGGKIFDAYFSRQQRAQGTNP